MKNIKIKVTKCELYALAGKIGGMSEAMVIILRGYDIPVERYTNDKVIVEYGEIIMTETDTDVLFEWKL